MKTQSLLAAFICCGVTPAYAAVVNTVTDMSLTGSTVDGIVGGLGDNYTGTVSGGGTGFGGPVGGGTLSLDSDNSGVYFGFSGMGDISDNSIRVYLDTRSGGFTELSDAAGFNDFDDFGRERVSRPVAGGLTLPFEADFGWIITPAFGGFQALFELQTGGNGSLIGQGSGVVADPIGEFPSNPTYEFFIPYANLGMSAGDDVDFVVVYGNNAGQDDAFISSEGFPGPLNVDVNPGNGPLVLDDFHRLTTVPEPATASLLGLGAMAMIRRRKNV